MPPDFTTLPPSLPKFNERVNLTSSSASSLQSIVLEHTIPATNNLLAVDAQIVDYGTLLGTIRNVPKENYPSSPKSELQVEVR